MVKLTFFALLCRITAKLNDAVAIYITIWGTVAYLMVAIPGIAILIDGKEVGRVTAMAKGMLFPMYISLVMTMWAWVSESLQASVSRQMSCTFMEIFNLYFLQVIKLDHCLFYCNWPGAPMRLKKIILLLKIRLNNPPVIRGPLFVINWEFLSNVRRIGQ